MSRLAVTISARKAVKAAQYKARSQIRFRTAAQVWGSMNKALSVVMENTPAWTGDTLANYVWGIGQIDRTYSPVNQDISSFSSEFPVEDRESYERISRARLNELRSEVFRNPYRRFVLWNNTVYDKGETIRDLEYGSLTGTAHLMFQKAKAVLQESR